MERSDPRATWRRQATTLLCALGLGLPAAANDYYVDPVAGSDSNSGTSPADAWRRVSHAFDSLVGTGHTIHLAPGVYSVAAGEVYPLPIESGVRIIGTAGSDATILEGGWFQADGLEPYYQLELEGVSLVGGLHGVHIFLWHEYHVFVDLVDVQVLGTTADGILVDAYGGQTEDAKCDVDLRGVRVIGCGGYGASASASAGGGEAELDLVARDCDFSWNAGWGLRAVASTAYLGDGQAVIDRCRVVGNRAGGIRTPPQTGWVGTGCLLSDSLIARNGGTGLEADDFGFVDRCTIVDNHGIGLDLEQAVYWARDTILDGNQDDVRIGPAGFSTSYCRVVDPDVVPGVGDTPAQPWFVDRAAGDYRLSPLSRLVDAGHPDVAGGHPDLAGVRRPVDGNLDAHERADIGALEMTPLWLRGPTRIGTVPELELWGPPGGTARVFFAPAAPLPFPAVTPFGELDLDRTRTVLYATTTCAPGPPMTLPVPIPALPDLVGTSWSFQSLTESAVPGAGPALTNAVHFVIEP